MSFIRCKTGEHLYDNELHSACPYCPQADRIAVRGGDSGMPETASAGLDAEEAAKRPRDTVAAAQRRPDFEGRTRAGLDPSQPEFDPVVGWLVVQSEINQGRDFRIRNGWNSIGRDTSNRIIVDFDMAVTRKNHASLLYDNEANSFAVKHGDGVSGTRLNGVMVGDMTPIKALDVIRVGATELVFIPLCQEGFVWKGSKPKSDPTE